MLTDCSSIQGSTTSSSSDVMTLTTAASSWCAIPTSSRIRILRLVRPHTRRILVTPDCSPSFGFTVRGGKEFGTGFFVSHIERNGEADLKGLRAGDQILRINGFRIDDAVHKELVQFVNTQDRITLKVRDVGLVPIKDKENDRLSWHVVKMKSISNTPSESSYKSTIERDTPRICKDINVVINVAPRTKLGLGICKGPEWKPGIFVQFTKDKSVAREAGLRPGDQILSVNSIDFSDVLFSEAVAVMKGSNKLEMVVRTLAGCELFPGESSGYNSSASSVTGDQSPCWADVKSKRLTAVREEPSSITAAWNESLYMEQSQSSTTPTYEQTLSNAPHTDREVNKTIIKLSENGTSINNTYIEDSYMAIHTQQETQKCTLTKSSSAVIPPPPPQVNFISAKKNCNNRSSKETHCSGQHSEKQTVIVDVHQNAQAADVKRQTNTVKRSASKTHDDSRTNNSNNNHNNNCHTLKSSTVTKGKSLGQHVMAATATKASSALFSQQQFNNKNNCSSSSSSTSQRHNNNNDKQDNDVAGSTLSSAITEELKKRKEKQRSVGNGLPFADNSSNNYYSNMSQTMNNNSSRFCDYQQQQHQQHQLQQHQVGTPTLSTSPSKRVLSTRANSNAANCNEQRNGNNVGTAVAAADQHSALMDEFKRAHQRMFRNGFKENESEARVPAMERQEALKSTGIMEDDTSHRASRNFNPKTENTNTFLTNGHEDIPNGHQTPQEQQMLIPPPPPQFANSSSPNVNQYKNSSVISKHYAIQSPPSTPAPDYDNVQMRTSSMTRKTAAHSYAASSTVNGRESTNNNTANRRTTMRLGTVTIGEYESEQQRREPGKFDFIATQKRTNCNTNHTDDTQSLQSELQNTLSRSNLKKSTATATATTITATSKSASSNGQNGRIEHQSNCPLQNNYETNVETVTRRLKSSQIAPTSAGGVLRNSSIGNGKSSNGILKNGSRNSNDFTAKHTEKSIKFDN